MKEKPKEVIVIESHKQNKDIGRNFYRWIYEELQKVKGGEDGEKNKK